MPQTFLPQFQFLL